MLYRLKKLTVYLLLSTLTSTSFANNDLPEIGTVGAGVLTIQKEKQYGWAFKMMAQQSLPIVRDPVLNHYITSLGENIVSHADSVKLPFEFFLVEDSEINAAAFLGGNIKINTGLFLYAETESELASVIAHEVAHITQRHLARMLEKQALSNPASMAALAGSVLLAIIAPAAGFAALTSTFAINIQNQINYTRANEYEADRIGIQTLAKAGYNPYGMADFFGKLAEKYKYASSQPQMLLTHPLPETRLAEARLRASQFINKHMKKSLDYQLSKARIIVRFDQDNTAALISRYRSQLTNQSYQLKAAAQYGLALAYFKNKQMDLAEKLNNQLLSDDPDNLFYLDLATDISLSTNQDQQAIKRLTNYENKFTSNAVSTLNLVIALQEDKQYELADKKLSYFIRNNPEHILAHLIAIDLYKETKQKAKEFATKAEYLALLGRFKEASEQMGSALAYTDKKLDQARYSAKIEEYKQDDLRLKELQE
ncbi:M48 family peptidase [Psychromonas sp. B3M02]|uniref:beta-barrel assembly-enhancing protease n=1 Tax=Psychromonas sp. B3M02 TaxID=2267226 RepID=UPI000DEB863D|nr:M48 family metalloprotease [Psychromonas sp. B3M02]RBW47539.1 M48 family peptidase [Psychromonas sp. B3M02]